MFRSRITHDCTCLTCIHISERKKYDRERKRMKQNYNRHGSNIILKGQKTQRKLFALS